MNDAFLTDRSYYEREKQISVNTPTTRKAAA
jgi:hypothetical protein